MSEFYVQVVEIQKVGKHPNADTLSITQVLGNYPCIIRTGEFNPGDKAVYISVDALLPMDDERWAFLRKDPNDTTGYHKVKAKKLRGIFSMGLLTKADPSWELGKDVRNELRIEKWEPEVKFAMQTEAEQNPGFIPTYTDIEGLRKYNNLFEEGEEVVCTEKIHGANGRWCFKNDRLWVGSHHQIKKDIPGCIWWEVIRQNGYFKNNEEMSEFKVYPGLIFFGEVYGQVQDLKYGTKNGELKLAIFDIYDTDEHKFLDWNLVEAYCYVAGLPVVPVLYKGPWRKDIIESLGEGNSKILGANCIREGFVIKPIKESVDCHGQRKILKYAGEGYLTRKEK